MKKFTSLLIGCSLMLAGAAIAQQPEEQASPAEKQAAEKGKGHGGEAKPGSEAGAPAKAPAAAPAKEPAAKMDPKEPKSVPNAVVKPMPPAMEQHGGKHASDAAKAAEATPKAEVATKAEAMPKVATPKPAAPVPVMKSAGAPAASAMPTAKAQAVKDMKAPAATASATPMGTATPVTKVAPSATPMSTATVAATASPMASATPAATAAASASAGPIPTPKPNTAAATKKPDVQKVQQIRTEHANFTASAQPNLQVAPAVTFSASYRVEGSDRWQGPQYEVYRSYRPERHDEGYYRSRYSRVELIGGGYYYQNNNYWYPAWGYNPRNEYYAYDGPIYVGHRGERPDRVIADVQASLKEMGYYTGAVDGLLGPLTRRALIGYQSDAGLTATATIDEPTLDSLNMGS